MNRDRKPPNPLMPGWVDMQGVGDKAVIEPRRGRGEQTVPAGVIMSFTPLDLALIRKAMGLGESPDRSVDFARLWLSTGGEQEVGLVGWAMGAPMAVYLMERLIALGARRIVGVGSCGSLQPRLRIGDVILPIGATIEEGTSAHYRGDGVITAPDPALLEALRGALVAEGVVPALGPVWTTDAPFRETSGKVTRYRDEGVLAVEMEASALMTVASFRRVSFCSLLVVSDELGDLKWRRGFTDPSFLDRLAQVARVAASVLNKRDNSAAFGGGRSGGEVSACGHPGGELVGEDR